MAVTSISIREESIGTLVAGDSQRNSVDIHISGTCTTDTPPTVRLSVSESGVVTTTVGIATVTIIDETHYAYSCTATIKAQDSLSESKHNITITARATGLPSTEFATVTLEHVKLIPKWSIPESAEIVAEDIIQETYEITNYSPDLSYTETHSIGIDDVDLRTQGEYTLIIKRPEQGQEDWITLTSEETDAFVSKSMTCNISYKSGKREQLWTIDKDYTWLPTEIPCDSSESYYITLSKDNTYGAVSIKATNAEDGSNVDKYIYCDIEDPIKPMRFTVATYRAQTVQLTKDLSVRITISAEGDQIYNAKTESLLFTVKANTTPSEKLPRDTYITIGSSTTPQTQFVINKGDSDILTIHFNGVVTDMAHISGSATNVISPMQDLENEDAIAVLSSAPEGTFNFTVHLPESNTYLSDEHRFTIIIINQGDEPRPLVIEPQSRAPIKSDYRISKTLLPEWHYTKNDLTSDFADISDCLIHYTAAVNKLTGFDFDPLAFKLADRSEQLRFLLDSSMFDTTTAVSIGDLFKSNGLVGKQGIVTGSLPMFYRAYDKIIHHDSNTVTFNVKRTGTGIKITNSLDTHDTITLGKSYFYDYSIPKCVYLLACAAGGDAGKPDTSYVGGPIVYQCGLAGGGGASVLYRINLSDTLLSDGLDITYTKTTASEIGSLLIKPSGHTEYSTPYIKLFNGQDGQTAIYGIGGVIINKANAAAGGFVVDHNMSLLGTQILAQAGGDTFIDDQATTIDGYCVSGQSVSFSNYAPFDIFTDGYYFPGGVFSGGTGGFEGLSQCGNGGGASLRASGGKFGYYFSASENSIEDLSDKPGAGAGGEAYFDITDPKLIRQKGGPAYFAILY